MLAIAGTISQLRSDLGDDGIIYHHESRDAWGWELSPGYYEGGLKAVFYDAYVDYTLSGEVDVLSEVDSPNGGYMRYYSSGYGLSQAIGEHKRNSTGKAAISAQELGRLMGGHLHGGGRTKEGQGWSYYFKPAFDARKDVYLNDYENFVPDVNWPIDSTTGWFRTLSPTVTVINSTTVEICWTTPGYETNGEVRYTFPGGAWWYTEYGWPIDVIPDTNIDDEHVIVINLEEPGTYEFRIRSTNDTNNPPDIDNQIIWGYVGSFTTSP